MTNFFFLENVFHFILFSSKTNIFGRKRILSDFRFKKQFQYRPSELGYSKLLEDYQIQSLETRWKVAVVIFINNLLTSHIMDSNPLDEIPLNVPRLSQAALITYFGYPYTK